MEKYDCIKCIFRSDCKSRSMICPIFKKAIEIDRRFTARRIVQKSQSEWEYYLNTADN